MQQGKSGMTIEKWNTQKWNTKKIQLITRKWESRAEKQKRDKANRKQITKW